jgi:hypothetical protein
MITRDALYTFIESLVSAAGSNDPLFEAVTFRNLRGDLNTTQKVIRVDSFAGDHNVLGVDGEMNRELNVVTNIQCWVTPEKDEEEYIDAAKDQSFEMSQAIFDAIAANETLNDSVCFANFREFETGEANLGAQRRGVTYLDGTVNAAQEG